MDDSNKREFFLMVRNTGDLFGREISAEVLSMWWGCLHEFELDAVRSAMQGYINSGERFMPVPGQIREALAPADDGEALALEAWESHGQGDPLGERAMRMVCPQGFGQTLVSEEKWIRKEFLQTYKTLHESRAAQSKALSHEQRAALDAPIPEYARIER